MKSFIHTRGKAFYPSSQIIITPKQFDLYGWNGPCRILQAKSCSYGVFLARITRITRRLTPSVLYKKVVVYKKSV